MRVSVFGERHLVVKVEKENLGTDNWHGLDIIWKAFQDSYNIWRKKENGDSLIFFADRKEDFIKRFKFYYENIKLEFMTPETQNLDAHKQISIMIISALETNVFEQESEDDKIPLGPQAVVLDVALSFLLTSINAKLRDIRLQPIRLVLPVALACETSYFDILRRMLYYEYSTIKGNRENGDKDIVNILEWSDRFFLLEYIILLENGIDPRLVKDSVRKAVNVTGN